MPSPSLTGVSGRFCPIEEARRTIQAEQTVERSGHVLIPGLINAHTHAAMTLRGA
jgi:cytosine/adenosine deaminase-related metal-dependent hydrolase